MLTVSVPRKVIYLTTCCLLGLLPPTASGATREAYRYRQQTGSDVVTFAWSLESSQNLMLTSVGATQTHRTLLDRRLLTLVWQLSEPDARTALEARREGNVLVLTGYRQGEKVHERLTIDDAPWYQAQSLSLRAFLAAPATSLEFWTLRPDKLTALKLRAVKKERERIDLGDRQVLAQRLEIRLTGLGALLGRSSYWLRPEDGLFLKYRGPEGMPGLETTTITLESPLPSSVSTSPDQPACGRSEPGADPS